MKLGTLSVSYEETAIVSLNDSSLTQEFVSTVLILLQKFQHTPTNWKPALIPLWETLQSSLSSPMILSLASILAVRL